MKILFILFLFVAEIPLLKVGSYKASSPDDWRFREDRGLMIHPASRFEHRYFLRMMCVGRYLECRRGAWKQNGDTLTLVDTLDPRFDLLPYLEDFHFRHNSTYSWIARYAIRFNGELIFAYSTVGDMVIRFHVVLNQ